MADNKHYTHHAPVILDENSSLPASMSEFIGEAGRKYVKNQSSSKFQMSNNGSMFLGDDEPEPGTITKQHWYFERPFLNMVTGGENFRTEYPDAFDDVVWEYAQSEWSAAIKDEYAYAEWFINSRIGVTTTEVDFGQAPPSNISADANEIMNRTRNSSIRAGVERAKTNPVVEDAMRNVTYRLWRTKAHRAWF